MRSVVASKDVSWPRLIWPALQLRSRSMLHLKYYLIHKRLCIFNRLCIFGPKGAIQICYYYYYYYYFLDPR